MKDKKHPFYLNEPDSFSEAESRIGGFIGGGIAGLVFGVIALFFITKFGLIPLAVAFYGLIASILFFAILGALRPKWFAWILDVLTFW